MQLQSKILSFRLDRNAVYSTQQLDDSIDTEKEFIHSIIFVQHIIHERVYKTSPTSGVA